jgi:hypothetical protein
MPRIVPSQVVGFIDRFPLSDKDGIVKMTDIEPYAAEAMSNQRTGWCCIHRLSWQR